MKRIIGIEKKDDPSGKKNLCVTYDDVSNENLLSFFDDEVSFSNKEVVGLTRDEALSLAVTKDEQLLELLLSKTS